MITRRHFTRLSFVGVGLGLANCTNLSTKSSQLLTSDANSGDAPSDLTVWWEQGFLPEENEQVAQIVRAWEQKSGLSVNLKFLPADFTTQQISQTIETADPSQLPDILYSVGVDASLAPILAWQDKLLDLSELVISAQDRYTPIALSQVFYRNQMLGERSYYALPLWQAQDYIHYWRPLIEELGYGSDDIPMEWDSFWQFWRSAQTQLRAKGYRDLYGVGLCMSDVGFDTYTSFVTFLDAHNVNVVSDEGELLLTDSRNRQRMIAALDEYTRFFLDGYVPPAAVEWTGGGNNSSFISGNIVMTQNLTLSIPLTQKLSSSVYNQDAAKRYQQMATIEHPRKTDGTKLLPRKGVKQAIVLKDCLHPQAAKDFLTYLIEPQNLKQLITGFKGRVLPVMPELFENSLWSDTTDPHLYRSFQISQQDSLLPYSVSHPAFSEVQNKQLWAHAVLKVIQDNLTPTEASDWAIDEIQNIWTQWRKNT